MCGKREVIYRILSLNDSVSFKQFWERNTLENDTPLAEALRERLSGFDEDIENPSKVIIGAFFDNLLIGYVLYTMFESHNSFILYYVDDNYSLHEIGEKLFTLTEDIARENCKKTVETASRIDEEEVARFLEKIGYNYFSTNAWGVRSWKKRL